MDAIRYVFLLIISLFVIQGDCENDSKTQQEIEKSVPKDEAKNDQLKLYSIEGSVDIEGSDISVWGSKTQILVDGGKYVGYLKQSGEFQIHNIPSGTYLVEVITPNHVFEPARVDISGKTGKIRGRRVNLLKTASVSSLPYPLKFKVNKQAEFFEKREQWNVMSILKNPMVLVLVAPLLIMVVMPKLLNNMDPDTHKEMQQSMQAFQQGSSMPSLEEMFTNFFGGGNTTAKKNKSAAAAANKKSKH